MSAYVSVYFWYTLSIAGVVALIARPFVYKFELLKLATVSALAVFCAIPRDVYKIDHGAGDHSPERVFAVVDHVSVEKYTVMVAHSVLTALWTLLCTRWSLPCLSFNHDERSYRFIRWTPILLVAVATAVGCAITVPGPTSAFYLGSVLWWTCPVFVVLWYGAGNFFTKKIIASSVSVVIPTLYWCYIGTLVPKNAVSHTDKSAKLNAFVSKASLLEDAIFFFVTDVLIVLAVNGFDKSRGMIDTYSSEFPVRFGFNWKFIRQLFRAFATPEYRMSPIVTDDIRVVDKIINDGSKSFWLTSHFFQPGTRLDLMIVYAFCRVTDDMIDDEVDVDKNKHKYNVIKQFIDELFADRKSDYDVPTGPQDAQVNWTRYQSELTDLEMAAYRAISRISFYFPRVPFDKILTAFRWDIENRPIKTEEDLTTYSNDVSGSIALMAMYALVYKSENKNYDASGIDSRVIKNVRQIGVGLQLVNLGRDIVVDSQTLGRCYVPTDWLEDEKNEIQALCVDKNPRSLGDEKIMKYSSIMLELANRHLTGSIDVVRLLPYDTRISVLVLVDVFWGVASAIQSSSNYPTRALPSTSDNILLGLYTLYVKSVLYIK